MKRMMTKEECESKHMEWVDGYHKYRNTFVHGYCRKKQSKDWDYSKEQNYQMDIKLIKQERERLQRIRENPQIPSEERIRLIKDANERIHYYEHRVGEQKKEKYKGVE